MIITKNNVETLVAVLTLLAEKNCTVTDAQDILSYASNVIRNKATVPKLDYRTELSNLVEASQKGEK